MVHICTTLSISNAPHGTYTYQYIANVCYCTDYIFSANVGKPNPSLTKQLIVGTRIGPNLYQTQYAVVHICTTLSMSNAPHGTYTYQYIANVCYCTDYIFSANVGKPNPSLTKQLIVGTRIGPNLYQTQYAVVHICTTLSMSNAPHGTYTYQYIANVCYCTDYIFSGFTDISSPDI